LEDAAVKECEKKKNQEDKTNEGWKRGCKQKNGRTSSTWSFGGAR
jgi:hypothetical protein